METRLRKPPRIPVVPMINSMIVEAIVIESIVEKKLKQKNPGLIISKEQIKKSISDMQQEGRNSLEIWDEHPTQAVIVAIDDELASGVGLRVDDKIAFKSDGNVYTIIYNKKKYYQLMAHDVVFRYLSDKV